MAFRLPLYLGGLLLMITAGTARRIEMS